MNQRELEVREVARCAKDFEYFASHYLKIVTKDSELRTLKINSAQKTIITSFAQNNYLMLLKARQLGSTTGIAAYFFWRTLFNKHMRTAVVAHTDEAVKKIFEIYRLFYDELPDFLRLKTLKARENEIKFETGSSIRVGSASSQSFRGGTYDQIHASEYMFWGDIEQAVASLFGTRTKNALVVLESTANGMGEGYDLWNLDSGYLKIFLSWKMDVDYILPSERFDNPTDAELEYSYENKLSVGQFNWMVDTLRTACANNWNIFNQEFPATPDDAFISTGSPFFPSRFEVTNFTEGYEEYAKPKKFGVYLIGVDTATGSPGGDYSAAMILDVTDRKKILMAASFYERVPPSIFSRKILEIAKRYRALAVIETNSYGLAVQDYFQSEGYPYMYRRSSFDKITKKWQNLLGYVTTTKSRPMIFNRLYEYVTRGWTETPCPRFCTEANRLQYNSRGKVEAASGQHDDMVMATGLALMGLDQVDDIEEEVKREYRPRSIREVLEWENATGKLWSSADKSGFADDSERSVFGVIGNLL
jgi:hypothetical protein